MASSVQRIVIDLISQCLQLYTPWECGFELTLTTYLATAFYTRSNGGRYMLQSSHRLIFFTHLHA